MTDLRTIEIIEYDYVSARRLALTPDVCRGLEKRYIAFDTETTGLDPESDRIVEFGAVLFESGVPADSFQCYVNPGVSISEEVSALNHISNETLQTAPPEEVAYRKFLDFIGDAANNGTIICGHVAAFDLSFLCRRMEKLGLTGHFRFVDTRQLAVHIPELEHHSLGAVAQHLGISYEMAHHAREDALTSGRILWRILGK